MTGAWNISLLKLSTRNQLRNWLRKEMDMTQSDMVTYATAFGQIKITGRLSPELQERGIKAIKRLALLWENDLSEIQNRMIDDLLSFPIRKD